MTHFKKLPLPGLITALALTGASFDAAAVVRFDEFEPIVEINATDGDVGFHVLLDGDAWEVVKIYKPGFVRVFKSRTYQALTTQGGTEIFMESAEPLCWDDPDQPDEDILTVEEFLGRFEEGTYYARGRTVEDEVMKGSGEFTHNLPAAPDLTIDAALVAGAADVTISWQVGSDLGNCAFPPGLIPDPGSVEVVRWEVVVEPDEDAVEAADLTFSIFFVQFPGEGSSVDIPAEWFQPYLDAGITDFKCEVGAKEESGNQTFTEIEFTVE